jgi:hypothetical protein
MKLVAVLGRVPTLLSPHESIYRQARPTQPALVPYPTTDALLVVLSFDSPLPVGERQELVRALVSLHRSIPRHPLWGVLLLHAFRPMLLSLRARDRGSKEDRDSRVLLAFFQALARTPVAGQPAFLALGRATARALFQGVRRERVHAESVTFDSAADPGTSPSRQPGPFMKCLAREMAARLAEVAERRPV